MRGLLLLIIISHISWATTIDLETILESNTQKDILNRAIEESYLSDKIKGVADSRTSPLSFDSTLSHGGSKLLSGFEYEVGFSKELKLGDVQKLEEQSSQLISESSKIEQKKTLISLRNKIKSIYHQYCLDREYLDYFNSNYSEFNELYEKKRRAYELGEISKRELLQIELEKKGLNTTLSEFSKRVQDELYTILEFANFSREDSLSCGDTIAINGLVEESEEFTLTQNSYEKRIESQKVKLKRYSREFDTIEVSTSYLKEVDRDLYSIGLSVPLNVSSKKYEYERASLMHQTSAIEAQREAYLIKSRLEIKKLKLKLQRAYQNITQLEQNLQQYRDTLLPLEKKSYSYGESSAVEYLLARQHIMRYEEKLLESKRGYYQTLFTLYNIMEKR